MLSALAVLLAIAACSTIILSSSLTSLPSPQKMNRYPQQEVDV